MTCFDHAPAALLLGQNFDKNTCFDQSNLSIGLQVNWSLSAFVYIRSLMIKACLIFVLILLSNKISVQIYKYTWYSVYVYIYIEICIIFYKVRGEEIYPAN